MKDKFLSAVTIIVGVAVVGGLVFAVAVPSLLRARVDVIPRGMPLEQYQAPAPATYPAAPQGAHDRFAMGGERPPAKLALREMAERHSPAMNTEAYARIYDNAFLAVTRNPLSTFSIDVDTAAYANVRRFLNAGQLPPPDAVRIEELINYFRFDYPSPEGDAPFSVSTSVAACPWKPAHKLVHIGLQARRLDDQALPPRNLVFLLDVSGSMSDPAKLPLLQASMNLLVEQLTARDRVAIVVYAGASGLVLPATPGDQKGPIRAALDALHAGGSTAGGAGIQLAYEVAREGFIEGGVNRVILATDGDFNVGITSPGDLVRLIEEKRKTGVFLSVLGFGMGNLKDATMEMLADKGNGNYAYIDSLAEGRKVLVTEAGSTLVTVAKDVKVQVEFNPRTVSAFRLIGYENRVLAHEDFNDDRKDAGDIGAGHTVTALYEVVPAGVALEAGSVDPLKYQQPRAATAAAGSGELATIKLRYKAPDGDTSTPLLASVRDEGGEASANLRFAAAVAEFGMLLRDSEHKGTASFAQALELGRGATGDDHDGLRTEFVRLVEQAQRLAETKRAVVGS